MWSSSSRGNRGSDFLETRETPLTFFSDVRVRHYKMAGLVETMLKLRGDSSWLTADSLRHEQIDAFPGKTRLRAGQVESGDRHFNRSPQMREDGFERRTMSAVLFALLFAPFAQAQQKWTRTYGGTEEDEGRSVQQTLDGGYIVAGKTASYGAGYDDFYLIKTNASGDTLWARTYGGTVRDWGWSVVQTPDIGYIIAGQTTSFGAGDKDYYLVKTNASGDTVWTRTYGGTGMDEGRSVQLTSDGGYIVAGVTTSFGAGSYDFYLVKTNAVGDTLWTRTHGGTNEEVCYSVRRTFDGGYVVVGYTASYGAGNEDVYLVKTDAVGDTEWTRTYGGLGNDIGFSVQQTPDSGYIIAGYTASYGAGNGDVYLVKTNSSGDTLWTRTYGGTNEEMGYSVQRTLDGGYVVAGKTASFGQGNGDVYLLKTNASGDTLWTRTWGGVGVDFANSVQQTSDGGYIVAGYTAPPAGSGDVYLVKTDADGSAAVAEPGSSRQLEAGSIIALPNPFTSFARIPGHEDERFSLYDISGKVVGMCRGDRVAEGLSPAVYFIKPGGERCEPVRIVKVR